MYKYLLTTTLISIWTLQPQLVCGCVSCFHFRHWHLAPVRRACGGWRSGRYSDIHSKQFKSFSFILVWCPRWSHFPVLFLHSGLIPEPNPIWRLIFIIYNMDPLTVECHDFHGQFCVTFLRSAPPRFTSPVCCVLKKYLPRHHLSGVLSTLCRPACKRMHVQTYTWQKMEKNPEGRGRRVGGASYFIGHVHVSTSKCMHV